MTDRQDTVSNMYVVELQWIEHLWNHENMFETKVVELMSVYHCTKSGGIVGRSFQFSLT